MKKRMNNHLVRYAIDKNGNPAFIEDVPNGEKCECFCPKCHLPLNAKNNGKINVHHFSHVSGFECEGSYESSMHIHAKTILEKTNYIVLPPSILSIKGKNLFEKKQCNIKNVFVEKPFRNFIPDITIEFFDGDFLFVEIYVTHPVGETKKQYIRDSKINAIEIDLSNISDFACDKEYMSLLVDGIDHKTWLSDLLSESYSKKAFALCEKKPISWSMKTIRIIYECPNHKRGANLYYPAKVDRDCCLCVERFIPYEMKMRKYATFDDENLYCLGAWNKLDRAFLDSINDENINEKILENQNKAIKPLPSKKYAYDEKSSPASILDICESVKLCGSSLFKNVLTDEEVLFYLNPKERFEKKAP